MSYQACSPSQISTGNVSPESSCFQNVSVWQLMTHSAIDFNIVAVWSASLPQAPTAASVGHTLPSTPSCLLPLHDLRSTPGPVCTYASCLLLAIQQLLVLAE